MRRNDPPNTPISRSGSIDEDDPEDLRRLAQCFTRQPSVAVANLRQVAAMGRWEYDEDEGLAALGGHFNNAHALIIEETPIFPGASDIALIDSI